MRSDLLPACPGDQKAGGISIIQAQERSAWTAFTDLPPLGAERATAQASCPRHGICGRRHQIGVDLDLSVTVASRAR
jgi:hypothetical protein